MFKKIWAKVCQAWEWVEDKAQALVQRFHLWLWRRPLLNTIITCVVVWAVNIFFLTTGILGVYVGFALLGSAFFMFWVSGLLATTPIEAIIAHAVVMGMKKKNDEKKDAGLAGPNTINLSSSEYSYVN